MSELSIGRSGSAETVFVLALHAAALALLGVVLAYWTWQWVAPQAGSAEAPAMPAAESSETRLLFGESSVVAGVRDAAPSTFTLLGIVAAGPGREGHAVIRTGPGQVVSVREGRELAGGVRLESVRHDHVVLMRDGSRETLRLPRHKH